MSLLELSALDGIEMTDDKTTADGESAAEEEATTEESSEAVEAAEASESTPEEEATPEPEAADEAAVPLAAAPAEEDSIGYWKAEPDHASVRRMLTADAPDVDLTVEEQAGGVGLNIFLLLLIVGSVIGGIYQLNLVSSAEALEAKRLERQAKEEAFLKEQLAKQKKYGVLRVESIPGQAVVVKDGEAIQVETSPAAAPATPDAAKTAGADSKAEAPAQAAAGGAAPAAAAGGSGVKAGMTPMNIMNMDIAQVYRFKIEKPGYEPYEFSVAEHLWTKDPTTNEYKFFKSVELNPINCEYWSLYDMKLRREVKFYGKCAKKPSMVCGADEECKDNGPCETGKAACTAHYEGALEKSIAVSDCACKIPPELLGESQ